MKTFWFLELVHNNKTSLIKNQQNNRDQCKSLVKNKQIIQERLNNALVSVCGLRQKTQTKLFKNL